MYLAHSVKFVCNIAGLCFGLFSAYLWFKASTAKVTNQDNPHNPGVELTYEDPKNPGEEIQVIASAMEQSRLNKIAAIFTAIALLFQAVSSALPNE